MKGPVGVWRSHLEFASLEDVRADDNTSVRVDGSGLRVVELAEPGDRSDRLLDRAELERADRR